MLQNVLVSVFLRYNAFLVLISFHILITSFFASKAEGFRVAASNAIPTIFTEKQFKDLRAKYTDASNPVLDGLIRDLMHVTSSAQIMEEDWSNVKNEQKESDDSLGEKRRKGPIKWYEKLAARALVIGVNYIQGWLAWQGIKKAAAERDRLLPKFPMF